MKYRPEIDGLRTVAVMPVILFHAGFETFHGGFVGVDVFFVISGYLITTILIDDMAQDRFSLWRFYERRARRILPALTVVTLASIPFAWVLLRPEEMRDFAQSVAAVSIFSSNILFWIEAGYFDRAAELKPLLHTWSLAVEEQYYIFFPLLLLALWRFGMRTLLAVLAVLFIASLALAEWGSRQAPSATFYLIHTRAWELLVGSFTAFALRGGPLQLARPLAAGLSAIGLMAILVPVFVFDGTTPFPSLHALWPTLGTALVILFAVPGTPTHAVLSWRGAEAVGLLSYSLYLWHQPIFAFTRAALNETEFDLPLVEISTPLAIALIGLTFVLAAISYRVVERPFRKKAPPEAGGLGRYWYLGAGGALGGLAVMAVAILISPQVGQIPHQTSFRIASDWPEDVRQHACLLQDEQADEHAESCYATRPEILLWGDSHAASLAIGLRTQSGVAGMEMTQLTQAGCAPILELPRLMFRANCNQINDRILAYIGDREYAHIVLHAAWLHEHYPLSSETLSDHLSETLQALQQASPGSNIVVVGATPRWPDEPVFARVSRDLGASVYSADARVFDDLNGTIDETVSSHGAVFIDPTGVLCAEGRLDCLISLRDTDSGEYFYTFHDNDHLSRIGSNLLARHILEEMTH